jgi:hypothetical protein
MKTAEENPPTTYEKHHVVPRDNRNDPTLYSIPTQALSTTTRKNGEMKPPNQTLGSNHDIRQSAPPPDISPVSGIGSLPPPYWSSESNTTKNHQSGSNSNNSNMQLVSFNNLPIAQQDSLQRRPPSSDTININDIGVQLVGVSSQQILGMTIQKHEASEEDIAVTTNNPNTTTATKKLPKDSCKSSPEYKGVVHSLGGSTNDSLGPCNSDVLDMYSYHRGREGMEARDKDSGELLCVEKVTDTNHDLDAPKLMFSVNVQFPLEESVDDDEGDNDGIASKKTVYADTVDWDLTDPTTPSPLEFATSIATDFGLSFGATLDLAASIEKQIETHISAQSRYSEPIAVKDPQGIMEKDRQAGSIIHAYRYDQVVQTGKGGFIRRTRVRHPLKSRSIQPPPSRPTGGNTSFNNDPSDTESISTELVPASPTVRRKSGMDSTSSTRELDGTCDDDNVEEIFVEELKKRTHSASVLDIAQKSHKNGVVGELELMKNAHCHICHKRADICYLFPCGSNNHIYCLYHVNVSTLGRRMLCKQALTN